MASGRTPGKRASDEPAAAPLGTDDEAAGTPATRWAVDHEIERAREGRGMQGLKATEAMKGRPGHAEEPPRTVSRLVRISAAVVIAILMVAIVTWIALTMV